MPPEREDALQQVRHYHQATKHFPHAYAKGPGSLDWDAQPNPFRQFAGCEQWPLPLLADSLTRPLQALYEPAGEPAAPSLEGLACVLELSLGLAAWKQYGNARWALRCNPSSGNLHPTEAYVLACQVSGLADGLYHYNVEQHSLELRCRFPTVATQTSQLCIGFSSIHWREAWKYGERAYRYCQLDLGHAFAAVSYAAQLLGWPARLLTEPGSHQLASLLGTLRLEDFGAAEAEQADGLIQLMPAQPTQSLSIEQWLARAAAGAWSGTANVLDPRHFYRWPIIDQVAAACHKPPTAMAPVPTPSRPPPRPLACAEPAARLLRQRRSAQAFDRSTPIALEDFFTLLDHLLPRPGQPPWDCMAGPAAIHLVLFVHRVTGLAPGLYALARSPAGLGLMQAHITGDFSWQAVASAPPHLLFYQLILGKAERMAARLACQQAIASDGAFAVAMLAEFADSLQASPWRFNQLYQEAGLIGQSLYIDAEALGLRGTGIGCFFDDGVHEMLGITGESLQSLYHFTLGGPIVDNRIISLPPYSQRMAPAR